MAKRKVLKITPILITLNLIVLFAIVGFYTFRLVKYYLIENGGGNDDSATLLVDEIKKKQSFLDETKGLVFDEEKNVFKYKGQVEDNYVLYSGMLFRIVAIDNENNIRMVSEDNVTLLYPGLDNDYDKSYVNKWLNKSEEEHSGIYENELLNSEELLTETYMCSDKIDDVSNITCEEYYMTKKITLLSLNDFKEAGGKSSYLYNGNMYYFGTLNSSNQQYFINEDGEIAINKKSSRLVSVKPVITLNSEVELIEGNGKKDSPYIIEKHDIKTAHDLYINDIVKLNDYNYKVVSVGEDKVKLALIGVLKDGENDLSMSFGGSNSAYSTSKNTLGGYLNSTFLDSNDLKDAFVESEWYTNKLSLTSLDYSNVYKSSTKAKVGMLSIADMYVNDEKNVFTLLRGMEASNIIEVINKDGILFGDKITAKYNVRPAFYLKGDLIIKSGKGTLEEPYELGVEEKNETKEGTEKESKTKEE